MAGSEIKTKTVKARTESASTELSIFMMVVLLRQAAPVPACCHASGTGDVLGITGH
jgi:hypothetical protein